MWLLSLLKPWRYFRNTHYKRTSYGPLFNLLPQGSNVSSDNKVNKMKLCVELKALKTKLGKIDCKWSPFVKKNSEDGRYYSKNILDLLKIVSVNYCN